MTDNSATGRTIWDFFSEVVRVLGSAAPYLLVAAGVVFAIIEIQEAGDRAREQSANALQEAYGEARSTYKDISSMSQSMIDNIKRLLVLQDDLQARISEAQSLHGRVTEQIEHAKLQRSAMNDDIRQHRELLASTKSDLAKAKGERDKAKTEQQRRLDEYRRLREAVGALASKILEQTEDEIDFEAIRSEIADIDREYISDPQTWLRAYANDPTDRNARRLARLEGLPLPEVERAVRESTEHFDLWLKIATDQELALIGVVEHDRDVLRSVVLISGDKSVGIDSVEVSPFLVGVVGRDPDDWFSLQKVVLGVDFGEQEMAQEFETWSLERVVLAELEDTETASESVMFDFITGSDYELRFLSFQEVKDSYRSVFDLWSKEEPYVIEYVERMARAAKLQEGAIGNLHRLLMPLAEVFEELIRSIAAGDSDAAAKLLLPGIDRSVLRGMANVVLQPGFRIAFSGSVDSEPIFSQQAPPPPRVQDEVIPSGGSVRSGRTPQIEIITSYEDPLLTQEERYARFVFVLTGDPEHWRLAEFYESTLPSYAFETEQRARAPR